MGFIGGVRKRLRVVALDGDEYANALEVSASLEIVGGSHKHIDPVRNANSCIVGIILTPGLGFLADLALSGGCVLLLEGC